MCEEWSGLVPSFWQGVVSKRLVRRFGLGNEVDVCFSASFRPHNAADLLCAKTIDHKHTWQTANYDQTQKQNIPINSDRCWQTYILINRVTSSYNNMKM